MRLKLIIAALAALLFGAPALAQTTVVNLPSSDPENTWLLDLSTGGRVAVQLRPDLAPNHVERIKTLTRQKFYDGLTFHRVIDGFMAQTGDPMGTGEGGSQLPDLQPEFNKLPHLRGVVSMARADALDSANSQFFIMLSPKMGLDGDYTAFGRVVDGMEYVDQLAKGEPPSMPSRIVQASIAADNVPPPPPGAYAATPDPASVESLPSITAVQGLPQQEAGQAN